MSFFKKHSEMLRNTMREISHKSSITNGLGNAIKALQGQNIDSCIVYSDDLSDNLCYYIEAIFIHGLKNNFFDKVSTILANNNNKPPEPNFWPFLMVFSHKDVLSQINNFSQIHSDIGRCRALLRLALNEGLLEGYLSAMIQDKSSVRHYYRDYAYLRDSEQPDIMKKYMEGLHLFEFKLACNSRMLNVWSPTPLMLSGVWSPPIVPEPVFRGIDAASYFDVDGSTVTTSNAGSDSLSKNESKFFENLLQTEVAPQGGNQLLQTDAAEIESTPSSVASCPDPMPQLLYDEVIEAGEKLAADLKITESNLPLDSELQKHLTTEQTVDNYALCNGNCPSANDFEHSFTESSEEVFKENNEQSILVISTCNQSWSDNYSLGNRIVGKDSWSSSDASHDRDLVKVGAITIENKSAITTGSYQELLQNYSPARSTILRDMDFDQFINSPSSSSGYLQNRRISNSSSSFDEADYEILPKNCSFLSADADLVTKNLIKNIGKISNERGLDEQNYQCKCCSSPIGMIYGKARVCCFDGYCYCQDCHDNEEYCIPARIIHNWDFKKYKISKQTMKFFQLIEDEPLIDIRHLNSQLYLVSPEMKELQLLRTQLSYLRSYLFTCRESVAEEMRRKLWPKDYLYDHIHLYSFKDLVSIPSRSLTTLLQKAVSFASKHVADCELCHQKGFICEICDSQKVIYPFELGQIYRCEICLAVYHSTCMSPSIECPKCKRKRLRKDQSDCCWTVEP